MTLRGRPMKYADLIRALDLNKPYSVATVVAHAEALGFLEKEEFRAARETTEDVRVKIRMAINRLAGQHLPQKEDALLVEVGQQPQRAWCGWRWKDAIPQYYFDDKELKAIEEAKKSYLHEEKSSPTTRKWEWLHRFFPRRVRISLAVFFTAAFLSIGFVAAFYPEGVRVFKERGPSEALDYFRGAEKFKGRDPVVVFGKAWSKYAVGNFEQAEKDAYRLIQNSSTPDITLGNSFYLLGKIKTRTGSLQEAREQFQRAQNIYEALDRPANLFKNYIGLTELALEAEDLWAAEAFIGEALEIKREAGMEPWELYQLQAELAFMRAEYHKALQFSYQYHSGYQQAGNLGKTANGLINIGFYLILTGQLNAGFEKTIEAQILINRLGDRDKLYFSLINLLLLRRCEGKSFAGIEEALIHQIDEKRDYRLQKQLEFALSYPCGIGPEEGGEEDQDPPPNSQ